VSAADLDRQLLLLACTRGHAPIADRLISGFVVAAYGLNYAVKLVARRPRPRLEELPPLTDVAAGAVLGTTLAEMWPSVT
jgi:hypothetical protein